MLSYVLALFMLTVSYLFTSHVLHLVTVLCFIYLNCANTHKKKMNFKKRFLSLYNIAIFHAFLSLFLQRLSVVLLSSQLIVLSNTFLSGLKHKALWVKGTLNQFFPLYLNLFLKGNQFFKFFLKINLPL